jgi:hypothetical protein
MEATFATTDLVTLVCDIIVKTVSSGLAQISMCALHRVSCEGWLKVELLLRLSLVMAAQKTEGVDLRSELDNVDLTIWTPS